MSIQELYAKLKGIDAHYEILLSVLIVTVAFTSFALGRISVREKAVIPQHAIPAMASKASPTPQVESAPLQPSSSMSTASAMQQNSGYVASKNGTKYHLPWCGSANQIKEENKIWFATKEDAEKAGYQPASNCKGI